MKTVIPRIWVYFLTTFLKTFFLLAVGLCCIIILARFQDIARFYGMVGSFSLSAKYLSYQLPYLLPFSLVLAAIFTSYLLGKSLSTNHELIALRMGGVSLFVIFTPIRHALFWIAALCALLSFAYQPYAKARVAKLVSEINTKNPFVVLKNAHTPQKTRLHLICEPGESDSEIQNVICGIYNPKSKGLELFLAEKAHLDKHELLATNATFISPSKEGLLLEDIQGMNMHQQRFSDWVQRNTRLLSKESTPLTTLFFRFVAAPFHEHAFFSAFGHGLFFPLAVFFLSQVGLYTSISISRRRSIWHMAPFLAALFFVFTGYVMGKALDTKPLLAFCLYVAPFAAFPFIIRSMRLRVEAGRGG